MPLDQTDERDQPIVTVEHLLSPVVECIVLLSCLTEPDGREYARSDLERLNAELPPDVNRFLKHWAQESPWDLLSLLDLILPFGNFSDTELLIHDIESLTDGEFLFHFLEEAVDLNAIEGFLRDPWTVSKSDEPALASAVQSHPGFVQRLFDEIGYYRRNLLRAIREVSRAKVFQERFQENDTLMQSAIQHTKSLQLEPLALAQHLMGKSFRRVSPYTRFTYIPSFYVSPRRVRVFNRTQCVVIYSCRGPLQDVRQLSRDLEIQTKALADHSRLFLLRSLKGRREYGARLAEFLGLTGATVSHHLDILRQAGFVHEERIGNIKYFTLNESNLERYFQSAKEFINREL